MRKVHLLAIAGMLVVSTVYATVVRENFTTNPALDGWRVFGNTNLFQWDATNRVLEVTWDSTQTNSYFGCPLGRTYTRADGFYVRFDVQLSDATAYNGGMELAIGLLHYFDATNSSFSRADFNSPNVCEFDYFPQFSYSGTVYPNSAEASLVDASGLDLYFASDNLTLNPGVTYRVELIHQAGAGAITCDVSARGQLLSSLPIAGTYGVVGDFQLDTLAVINYTDDGYGDSILAHGRVGNLAFASPLPIGLIETAAAGQVWFASDTNWQYTLEASADMQHWATVAPVSFGNGTNLVVQATNPPANQGSYRVRAELP